jgi:adenylosuccinate lyase
VERIILPDSTILADYMLARTADLIDTLVVYPERMRHILESTGGLVFSGQLLLDLVEGGTMTREDAYRIVQRNAMKAWQDGANFRALIDAEPEIASRISRKQIERAFDLDRQLRNVDKIFARVFGERETKPQRARRN